MHHIGYLLTDGFQVMGLATQTVFEYANKVAGEDFYALRNFSVAGGDVRSSLGMTIATLPVEQADHIDSWMVCGVGNPLESPSSQEERSFLQTTGQRARRIAAICTGGFVLAESGLLSKRRATTHWFFARDMQARFPDIQVEDDRIYIVDGAIWTSAGMTAGLDMALAMVGKDLGEDVARGVAHNLVMHQHRTGGQTQHSEMLSLAPKTDRIQNALNYARKNLMRPLTVEELAEEANLSPRQFSRVFTAETGLSPSKAIEGLRLEAARLMIEQSRHPLEVIARETGFRDRRHMREVFMRGYGVPPQSMRREVRA
ncbi:GlxA family transcriptional regulator [Herbaspirillum sp. BH-1]|uniref:Transcriptional regulator GlxA family with amidase domain n=1 Tax=Herbaspirillum frisingense TaxID=92645 RepID=A0ABU1PA79_9BURK|nr:MULTISPECIES: GlxA family transcriptional regulator [Herbaspirillum]MDR6582837.1 transcriptional regulator GlxA family with amidase domain [Herbaspirillum frisingense]PLY60580.1 GlxA family transcriptional regulator [Herbaspirillum sp. BH-1]QNB07903.1 GlxA family transcriptional regulator [Herbaspirillum frisingense]UIN19592.1 GlxA family transcriptional regulator [Herbaspirillum frisingense]